MPDYCIGKTYREGTVKHLDGQRRNAFIKIDDIKKIAVLPTKHSTKDMQSNVKVGDILQNLVNIGSRNKSEIFVAQKKYFEELQKGFSYKSFPKSRNVLFEQKWQSVGSGCKDFQIRKRKPYPPITPYEFLTHDFRCPVYACSVVDINEQEKLFYPGSFYRDPKEYCVYPAAEEDDFPQVYRMIGDIKYRDGTPMELQIELKLHNFLDLFNWHYHTIKHVCGHFDPMQKELWERFFPNSLNTKCNRIQELNNCRFIQGNNKCDIPNCVESNQFQKIHPQLLPVLKEYSNSIVTMFQKADTIKMNIDGIHAFGAKDIYFKIELLSKTNIGSNFIFFTRLVGTCFEIGDSGSISHIHVHPITAFIMENNAKNILSKYYKQREDTGHVLNRWGSGTLRFNIQRG